MNKYILIILFAIARVYASSASEEGAAAASSSTVTASAAASSAAASSATLVPCESWRGWSPTVPLAVADVERFISRALTPATKQTIAQSINAQRITYEAFDAQSRKNADPRARALCTLASAAALSPIDSEAYAYDVSGKLALPLSFEQDSVLRTMTLCSRGMDFPKRADAAKFPSGWFSGMAMGAAQQIFTIARDESHKMVESPSAVLDHYLHALASVHSKDTPEPLSGDCLNAAKLAQLVALRDRLTPAGFDLFVKLEGDQMAYLPDGRLVNFRCELNLGNSDPTTQGCGNDDLTFMGTATRLSPGMSSEMTIGDIIVMQGVPTYSKRHPAGHLASLNVVYVGKSADGHDLFTFFDGRRSTVAINTRDEIKEMLVRSFMADPCDESVRLMKSEPYRAELATLVSGQHSDIERALSMGMPMETISELFTRVEGSFALDPAVCRDPVGFLRHIGSAFLAANKTSFDGIIENRALPETLRRSCEGSLLAAEQLAAFTPAATGGH